MQRREELAPGHPIRRRGNGDVANDELYPAYVTPAVKARARTENRRRPADRQRPRQWSVERDSKLVVISLVGDPLPQLDAHARENLDDALVPLFSLVFWMSVSAENTSSAASVIRAAPSGAGAESLRAAYLDLLKLALSDLAGARTRTVTRTGDKRVFSRELTDDQVAWRAEGKDWPENGLTMIGLRRLGDLQACVEAVVRDGVDGDLIEAGAWRGGASILMRATLNSLGEDRTVYVADAFGVFPVPEGEAVPEDRELALELSSNQYLATPLEEVEGYFERFGCERGVRFVPGLFEDTLAGLAEQSWALIRLDGDTYKATRVALEALYPRLAAGGYLIIDDYHHSYLPQCKQAVDDYRRENGITEPIERVDWSGARWRREDPAQPPARRSAVPPRRPRGSKREAPQRGESRIPTDRELQLSDEARALRDRIRTLEAELESLSRSRLAGASAWVRRKALGRRSRASTQ
jgi:O-methyltransferase